MTQSGRELGKVNLFDLLTQAQTDFAQAVLAGLAQPQKVIPARFFYDKRGSELFEEITQLPEYYPTRTERALLTEYGAEIAELAGDGRTVVEFGSGSSAKTRLLLDAVQPSIYVPIDISDEFLAEAARATADEHPEVRVIPIAGDFTMPLHLGSIAGDAARLGFFSGSTIGNFGPAAAVDLLRSFAATLGMGSQLLIGVDLRKDSRTVLAAYDDSRGITATFNKNLLERVNRELGGTIPVEQFQHRPAWNDALGRLEMHLAASVDLEFTVAGRAFSMRAGETIHTENSYKYTIDEAQLLARASGWEPMTAWSDAKRLFSLHLWETAPVRIDP